MNRQDLTDKQHYSLLGFLNFALCSCESTVSATSTYRSSDARAEGSRWRPRSAAQYATSLKLHGGDGEGTQRSFIRRRIGYNNNRSTPPAEQDCAQSSRQSVRHALTRAKCRRHSSRGNAASQCLLGPTALFKQQLHIAKIVKQGLRQ